MDTVNKRHSSGVNGGIDKLPDDILINILSRLNIKEASRASVLAPRWRYLWRFSHGILRFDNRDTVTGAPMEWKEFESCVSTATELHQGPKLEGIAISFDSGRDVDLIRYKWIRIKYKRSRALESWVSFASRREVQRLELNFSPGYGYKFQCVASNKNFCCLRTLRLAYVDVEDEVVQYFLGSCPYLEELRVRFSYDTKNLRVIDSPGLRVLEISRCFNIRSLEISAPDLVSLTYGGSKRSLQLKKFANLRELNVSDDFCKDFIATPKDHWSYSAQLEKLVLDFRLLHEDEPLDISPDLLRLCSLKRLEVQVVAEAGMDLLFVTTLIKASPQLREFRIEMFHSANAPEDTVKPFPGVQTELSPGVLVRPDVGKYAHKNLKEVEINGYIGCLTDEKLVKALVQIGGRSLERVAIDTKSDYYDSPELEDFLSIREEFFNCCWSPPVGAMTQDEAKEQAGRLVLEFPRRIKFVVT